MRAKSASADTEAEGETWFVCSPNAHGSGENRVFPAFGAEGSNPSLPIETIYVAAAESWQGLCENVGVVRWNLRTDTAECRGLMPCRRPRKLGEQLFHDTTANVRQAEVAARIAKRQAFVIEAEQM